MNGEVVAKRWLRDMNIRGSPKFFIVSPRKVPFAVAKEPDEWIGGFLDGRLQLGRRRLVHRRHGRLQLAGRELGVRSRDRCEDSQDAQAAPAKRPHTGVCRMAPPKRSNWFYNRQRGTSHQTKTRDPTECFDTPTSARFQSIVVRPPNRRAT